MNTSKPSAEESHFTNQRLKDGTAYCIPMKDYCTEGTQRQFEEGLTHTIHIRHLSTELILPSSELICININVTIKF